MVFPRRFRKALRDFAQVARADPSNVLAVQHARRLREAPVGAVFETEDGGNIPLKPWNIYGKSMENMGKSMENMEKYENIWGTMGKSMEHMETSEKKGNISMGDLQDPKMEILYHF